jgi:valyl-tRNA synthetase
VDCHSQAHHTCWLDIDAETAKNYLRELDTKQVAQQQVVTQLEKRLSNTAYVANAPTEVVEETKAQLETAKQLLTNLDNEKERFKNAT